MSKLSYFQLEVPDELVARHPAPFREDARLMVADSKRGTISHHKVSDLPSFFDPHDLFVFNDSRVLSGAFVGYKEKTGAPISMVLLRELDPEARLWDATIDPARKIRIWNKLYFGDYELVAEVLDNTTSRERTVKFPDYTEEEYRQKLDHLGTIFLPLQLQRSVEPIDAERYQSVFAGRPGSVVAPVGCLHFSELLLTQLELKDIDLAFLTLHIGMHVLHPLGAEDLNKCRLPCEPFEVSQTCADKVNRALAEGRQICAVDLSTLKAMESSLTADNQLRAKSGGSTNLFLTSPGKPNIATSLLTNFHLPQTIPHIESVSFGGYEFMTEEVYPAAIREGYRFFVYGDALLILR